MCFVWISTTGGSRGDVTFSKHSRTNDGIQVAGTSSTPIELDEQNLCNDHDHDDDDYDDYDDERGLLG